MNHRHSYSLARLALVACPLVLLTAWGCQQGQPQGTVRIGEIHNDPGKFSALSVVIRGVVQTYELPQSGTFGRGYNLVDQYGQGILVRTTNDLPAIGTELFVGGPIAKRGDILFISETSRRRVGFDWQDGRTMLLYSIGGVLVVLLGLILWASMGPEAPQIEGQSTGSGGYGPKGHGEREQTDPIPDLSGDVTKTVPLSGGLTATYYRTHRLLPGILVVADGDKDQGRIHLYTQDGSDEVEIGRKSPDVATTGIRLEDPTATIGRRQASIRYLGAESGFQIKNGRHVVNPTILNGRAMGSDEVADLPYDSTVSMGAVNLRFIRKD